MSIFDLTRIASEQTSEQAKPLLLLIDDEPQNLKIMAYLLADTFSVLTADSAEQAINQLDDLPPGDSIKVMILDRQMPGVDTTTLFQQLNQKLPRCVNVLLSELNAAKAEISNALIFDRLNKPVDPKQLQQCAKNALKAFDKRQRLISQIDRLNLEIQEVSEQLAMKKLELESVYYALSKVAGSHQK